MVVARQREKKAMAMRKAGASYDLISSELGITPQGAAKVVKRCLERIEKKTREDTEHVLVMELARLDAMLMGLWDKARRGHEGAVDRVLRIMERRARLLGLDAPSRSQVQADIDSTVRQAQVVTYFYPDNKRGPEAIEVVDATPLLKGGEDK
jgi:hypothetical protein